MPDARVLEITGGGLSQESVSGIEEASIVPRIFEGGRDEDIKDGAWISE